MSRSFKKTLGNHSRWIRNKMCCVKNDSLKNWRSICNRIMRRKNRQILDNMDIEDEDNIDDVNMLDHYKKTDFGDDWCGPHDGYYYNEPESHKDYCK